MRWDRDHESRDVVDRRDQRSVRGPDANLAWMVLRLGSRFGWKGTAAALALLAGVFVVQNFAAVTSTPGGEGDGDGKAFVSFVLDDVQTSFAAQVPGYRPTTLVLYREGTNTGCGYGDAASGPFYCPADQRVYLDLSFFDELSRRFDAPGDFAQAYVVAHEVGHHLQHLQGRDAQVSDRTGATSDGVRLELQADCFAGVWGASAARRGVLEPGDLEEGLAAAAAIGDDRLQRQSRGRVAPDSFTHGTSEQRQRWLRAGFDAGDLRACDTFSAARL